MNRKMLKRAAFTAIAVPALLVGGSTVAAADSYYHSGSSTSGAWGSKTCTVTSYATTGGSFYAYHCDRSGPGGSFSYRFVSGAR